MRARVLVALIILAPAIAGSAEPQQARVIDSKTDRVPEQTVVPVYPKKARRDRIEGEVQVCFEVDRSGRPRRVAVRRSSHRIFERPSLRAVKASTFRPLDDDKELQAIKSCRTFVFSLQPVQDEMSLTRSPVPFRLTHNAPAMNQ